MNRLSIFRESGAGAELLCRQMSGIFETDLRPLDDIERGPSKTMLRLQGEMLDKDLVREFRFAAQLGSATSMDHV